ncbi:MAG: peptide ABC transporter substrate-binding protein [Gemmatimonadetes bacterium]|nr:peptide ABC transporter substrate-binding protein [Gemmatimonadota bacterium]
MRIMRVGRRASTCGVIFVLVAAACAPSREGPAVAVVASGADLESANPLVTVHPMARQVQRYALFVTLARYAATLEPEPYFARRWEWSGDRRTLTLHLWPGLRWHDGEPTTARDVAFTLDAARDPATGYYRKGELAGIERVEALDDTTVALGFASPPPRFPLVLCELPVVPRHILEHVPRAEYRTHSFARAPVGNGPFRFVERRPRESWRFARVDDFPPALGGPAAVDQLVIAVVDEATTKFAGLASGDLDLAGISPAMAALAASDPSLRLLTYPVAFTNVLVFNTTRPPFDDARVRRAISAAVDRGRLVEVALQGMGVATSGPVFPGHVAWDSTQQHANAAALLDSAGYTMVDGQRRRGGVPLTFALRSVGSGDNAMEQLIQADLRAIGVVVTLQQVELGTFLRDARAEPRAFDVLLTGIPGDLALSHVAAMFATSQRGGALDYASFHSARLDSLLDRAAQATGPALGAAWRAVSAELREESPVAWLYHSRGVQGARRELQGIEMDLRGELVSVTRWHFGAPARVVRP